MIITPDQTLNGVIDIPALGAELSTIGAALNTRGNSEGTVYEVTTDDEPGALAIVAAHAGEPLPTREGAPLLADTEGVYSSADISRTIPFLEKGRNTDDGMVIFSDTRTAHIDFEANFTKPPRLSLTPLDTSAAPAYRQDVTEEHATIRFKQKWTGAVEWFAVERK